MTAGCGFDSSSESGGGDVSDGGGRPEADAGGADAAAEADAGPIPATCDAPWVQATTGCYQFIKDVSASFDSAQLDCQTRGGHLVVEDKPGEHLEVAAGMGPLGELDRFWIGLHDPLPDDNMFVWVTGQALGDPHWAGTEPSGTGDCVNSRGDGSWGDRSCDELKWFVCEKND